MALVLGTAVGHRETPDFQMASGEAATAQRMLEQAGFKVPAAESVLVRSDRLTTGKRGESRCPRVDPARGRRHAAG